jgi:hypothetical protein
MVSVLDTLILTLWLLSLFYVNKINNLTFILY